MTLRDTAALTRPTRQRGDSRQPLADASGWCSKIMHTDFRSRSHSDPNPSIAVRLLFIVPEPQQIPEAQPLVVVVRLVHGRDVVEEADDVGGADDLALLDRFAPEFLDE